MTTSDTTKPTLGFWSTVAIGIGGMVGGGIFAVLGIGAGIAQGAVPIAFLVAGTIALLTSYSYAKLSIHFPSIGGTVTFINEAFGFGIFSGGCNLLLLVSYVIMIAVYAHAFGNYALQFFPRSDHVFWGYVLRSGVVVCLALLNAWNPRAVVKSELWVDGIKVFLLVFFVCGGLGSIEFHRLSPASWPTPFEVLAGGMTLFLCYEGFELIANASKEVIRPEKTIPRAYYSCILIVIVLYILISMVVVGNLSLAEIEKNSGWALAESARPFLGNFGFTLTAVAALFAAGSAINASLYGSSRISFILAKQGQLFGLVHGRAWKRPIGGPIFMTILSLLAANFLNLASVSTLGSAGFLLIFAVVNGANLKLHRQTKSMIYLPILGMIACLSALVLLLSYTWKSSPEHSWELIGILVLAFAFQTLYQKFFGPGRRTSIEQLAKQTESPAVIGTPIKN